MRKTRTIYFFSIAITAILIGTGCLGAPYTHAQEKASSPFSGIVIHPWEVKPFEIIANVMSIHHDETYSIINVAEVDVLITSYRYENKVKKTRLLNQNGKIVKLQDFEKWQWVKVRGLQREDGTVIADYIQMLPDRK